MSNILQSLFDPDTHQVIESVHRVQKRLYGVYVPPTLKQVINLRQLLIKTGFIQEMNPEELLGLSKIECKIITNKLTKIYNS